ncbi:MAG: DUF2270 domain-containing protein [Hyphomicrobiales bacterium]|nr:MAG: DUF2270 domain-containing protein [Hyphomicrobiales bacterium]
MHAGLQIRRCDLEQPRHEQDEEHPDIVPPQPPAHHGLVLFAMIIVMLLLGVEARRYRFFDVYRMRVRQFERHYFGQFFGPETQSGPNSRIRMALNRNEQPQRAPRKMIRAQ